MPHFVWKKNGRRKKRREEKKGGDGRKNEIRAQRERRRIDGWTRIQREKRGDQGVDVTRGRQRKRGRNRGRDDGGTRKLTRNTRRSVRLFIPAMIKEVKTKILRQFVFIRQRR